MEKSAELEAIGLLQCAEMNCLNVSRLGIDVGVKIVQMQIQQALRVMGGELVTDDVAEVAEWVLKR